MVTAFQTPTRPVWLVAMSWFPTKNKASTGTPRWKTPAGSKGLVGDAQQEAGIALQVWEWGGKKPKGHRLYGETGSMAKRVPEITQTV